jgi:NAD-dependent DNA ligase
MQKQKYEENLANGVDLKTLLTKEKLEQWHGVEGKTYAYIAAEIVGCKEEKISSLIEAFGIQRPNKNMAQDILVGKKTSKK